MTSDNTYDILWKAGSLGLALKPNPSHNMLTIRRIGRGDATGLACTRIGDVLVKVNDQDTRTLGVEQVVSELKNGRLPIKLTFESKDDIIVTVKWGDEPLGISVAENSKNQIYIDRVAQQALKGLQLGDILMSIANISVTNLGFQQSIQLLTSVKKPVELTFIRPKVSFERQYSDLEESLRNEIFSQPFELDDNQQNHSDDLILDWHEGPLGFTLKPSKYGQQQVLVSRLTGRGYTERLNILCSGDELTGVNEYRTRQLGFDQTLNLLRTLPKPVSLSFCQVNKCTREF